MAKALAGPRATDRPDGPAETARGARRRGKALVARAIGGHRVRHRQPEIRCSNPQCTITDRRTSRSATRGSIGGGQLEVTQPMYSFGKGEPRDRAAKRGRRGAERCSPTRPRVMSRSMPRARTGASSSRASSAYMLDDGIEQIDKAGKRMDERTGKDAPTLQDRKRLALLLATAKVAARRCGGGGAPGTRGAARTDRRGRCRRRRCAARRADPGAAGHARTVRAGRRRRRRARVRSRPTSW